jgi:hypothetical protein
LADVGLVVGAEGRLRAGASRNIGGVEGIEEQWVQGRHRSSGAKSVERKGGTATLNSVEWE